MAEIGSGLNLKLEFLFYYSLLMFFHLILYSFFVHTFVYYNCYIVLSPQFEKKCIKLGPIVGDFEGY